MAMETYYIGSQDEINKMYENNFFLEEFFTAWCPGQGCMPEYPGDGNIYKITLDPSVVLRTAELEKIGPNGIPDNVLSGCTILRSNADINYNNVELVRDTLSMWSPAHGWDPVLPDNDHKYFLNFNGTRELIRLDKTGKVIDGINLLNRGPAPQANVQNGAADDDDDDSNQTNIYVVRLAEAPVNINNVRLLKQDDKYIMYPNISPFCRSGIAGARVLHSIIEKISDISNNFADADKATNNPDDNTITIFGEIEQEHKDRAMSVDDFMNRPITVSGAAREFI